MQNFHEHDLAGLSRRQQTHRVISKANQDTSCLGLNQRQWHILGLVATVVGLVLFIVGIILVCVFKVADEAVGKARGPAILGLLFLIFGGLCFIMFVVYICYVAKHGLSVYGTVRIRSYTDNEQQKLEKKIVKKQQIIANTDFSTPNTRAFTNKAFALKGLRQEPVDIYV